MSDYLTSDELERFEKLALSLLVNPDDQRQAQSRLFFGKIPENLPVELPTPPQTEVLGSLARSNTLIEIVLESELSAEDVTGFYLTRLTALGWQVPDVALPYHPGGFISPGVPRHRPDTFLRPSGTFCHQSSGAGLTVSVLPQEHHTTRVQLELSLGRDMNPCAELAWGSRRAQGMRQIIPFLAPPPGAQQQPHSGGGTSHEFYSTAMLTTKLGLEEVAKHYAEQLRRANWTQSAQGTSGPLAWQAWQFTGEEQEPWTGLFFALHMPEQPADYFLLVRATWNAPMS